MQSFLTENPLAKRPFKEAKGRVKNLAPVVRNDLHKSMWAEVPSSGEPRAITFTGVPTLEDPVPPKNPPKPSTPQERSIVKAESTSDSGGTRLTGTSSVSHNLAAPVAEIKFAPEKISVQDTPLTEEKLLKSNSPPASPELLMEFSPPPSESAPGSEETPDLDGKSGPVAVAQMEQARAQALKLILKDTMTKVMQADASGLLALQHLKLGKPVLNTTVESEADQMAAMVRQFSQSRAKYPKSTELSAERNSSIAPQTPSHDYDKAITHWSKITNSTVSQSKMLESSNLAKVQPSFPFKEKAFNHKVWIPPPFVFDYLSKAANTKSKPDHTRPPLAELPHLSSSKKDETQTKIDTTDFSSTAPYLLPPTPPAEPIQLANTLAPATTELHVQPVVNLPAPKAPTPDHLIHQPRPSHPAGPSKASSASPHSNYFQRQIFLTSLESQLLILSKPTLNRSPLSSATFLATTSTPGIWPSISTMIQTTISCASEASLPPSGPRIWIICDLWSPEAYLTQPTTAESDHTTLPGSARRHTRTVKPETATEVCRLKARFGEANVTLDQAQIDSGAARILVVDEAEYTAPPRNEKRWDRRNGAVAAAEAPSVALPQVDLILWPGERRLSEERLADLCVYGGDSGCGALTVIVIPREHRKAWRKVYKVLHDGQSVATSRFDTAMLELEEATAP